MQPFPNKDFILTGNFQLSDLWCGKTHKPLMKKKLSLNFSVKK